METWKDIEEYEGLYQISNTGKVKSLKRTIIYKNGVQKEIPECLIKSYISQLGYIGVKLNKENKRTNFYIHRLIAQYFIPNPDGFEEVNHIDHNKENNNIDNLEWCDRTHNIREMIKFYNKEKKRTFL